MDLILEIILIAFICFLTDFLTYWWIRHLDKKEREKIMEKETKHIRELIAEISEENEMKKNNKKIEEKIND